jgi:hypothetical protein
MNTRNLNCIVTALGILLIAGAAVSLSEQHGGAQAQQRSATTAKKAVKAEADELPAMVRNGLPGPMHDRLNSLLGKWQVEMAIYIAGGSPERPVISRDLTCRREWIAETGNRYLRDVTEGSVGGNRYYRMGLLGYSTMDKRYEWVTIDALNANMMIYRGRNGDSSEDISMTGEFTDQGVLGERYAGKTVGMRTVIRIESSERNVVELYVTPPQAHEFLATRAIYTRLK